MADIRLSPRAETDLAGIADYSIETFGVEQARQHRDDLEACFRDLVRNPRLGRRVEWLAPGLRRFEHRLHVVFYAEHAEGVLIIRVLHARMDPPRHL